MRLLPTLALLLGLFLQSGAAASSAHPVRGFLPDLRFTLVGANGKTVTQDDFKGKMVMLFFGYASCPDICPTTMAHLSQVMHNLGDQAKQASILLISVDPHRDTPDILDQYVRAFDTQAIGLTGSPSQIADVAKRYRVSFQIGKPIPGQGDNYDVAHSRGIYFFDANGRARFLASDGESVATLTDAALAALSP